MARISVDNSVSELTLDPQKKLGDLLEEITNSLPEDRIVTGICLDGKHISRAERNIITGNSIQNFAELSIRTSNRAIWITNGIDLALSSMERVQKSLLFVAELFKEENLKEGNHIFSHCIEGLERFTETMLITRCVLKLDYSNVNVDGLTLSKIEDDLSSILRTIMESQKTNDHDDIADRIEYELIPNLCTFQKGLRQVKNSVASNA